MSGRDDSAGRNLQSLSTYAECAGCEEKKPVMVAPDGHYCSECVPKGQLERVFNAIHRGY